MSVPYGTIPGRADVESPLVALGQLAGVVKRVSWPAIFSGVVLVLAVEVLLNMLGAGVGLSLVNPNGGGTPDARGFGIGAGIWWFASTVIALVFGCYVAARLAGVATRFGAYRQPACRPAWPPPIRPGECPNTPSGIWTRRGPDLRSVPAGGSSGCS